MKEKIVRDMRLAVEFIMRVKPYSEDELNRKDLISFLEMLDEAQAQTEQEIAQLKKDTQ